MSSKNLCVVPVESYNGLKSCLKESLDYVQAYLLRHDRELGRITPKNISIAENAESLIARAMNLLNNSHQIRS